MDPIANEPPNTVPNGAKPSATTSQQPPANSTTPSATTSQPPANKIISLAIKDLTVLYSAYMPFVDKGGLFIPTKKEFKLGEVLPLLISLMNEEKKYQVDSKIVWITPDGIPNRVAGIGVQFNGPEAIELNQKIDKLLQPLQSSNERTNTM